MNTYRYSRVLGEWGCAGVSCGVGVVRKGCANGHFGETRCTQGTSSGRREPAGGRSGAPQIKINSFSSTYGGDSGGGGDYTARDSPTAAKLNDCEKPKQCVRVRRTRPKPIEQNVLPALTKLYVHDAYSSERKETKRKSFF